MVARNGRLHRLISGLFIGEIKYNASSGDKFGIFGVELLSFKLPGVQITVIYVRYNVASTPWLNKPKTSGKSTSRPSVKSIQTCQTQLFTIRERLARKIALHVTQRLGICHGNPTSSSIRILFQLILTHGPRRKSMSS